jgi:hypothetical protein
VTVRWQDSRSLSLEAGALHGQRQGQRRTRELFSDVRKADIILLLVKTSTYAFFFSSASSLYPGRTPSRTYEFGPEPSLRPQDRDYESYPTTEEDSANEEDLADLTQGPPGKIYEAMATEACLQCLSIFCHSQLLFS